MACDHARALFTKTLFAPIVQESNRSTMRIGIGHDTHRLEPGGPLRLGGIDVPHDHQMVGHSDADVLLHAITDALMGSVAAGDIGEQFPNTDQANKDRDSAEMLTVAAEQVIRSGYEIRNLDCIVFAEQPKLSAFKQAISQRIAEILNLQTNQVSIKAKTGEGVGPVGQKQAIMAECVVLVEEQPATPSRDGIIRS